MFTTKHRLEKKTNSQIVDLTKTQPSFKPVIVESKVDQKQPNVKVQEIKTDEQVKAYLTSLNIPYELTSQKLPDKISMLVGSEAKRHFIDLEDENFKRVKGVQGGAHYYVPKTLCPALKITDSNGRELYYNTWDDRFYALAPENATLREANTHEAYLIKYTKVTRWPLMYDISDTEQIPYILQSDDESD